MSQEKAIEHITQALMRIGCHDSNPDLMTYNNQIIRERLQDAIRELETNIGL